MNLSKYDWKFRLFGIPICIKPSFWVLCAVFSPFLTGNFGETPWLFGLLGWTAAVLCAFLTHELGHALVVKNLCGARPAIDLGIGRASNGSSVFGGLTSWTPVYSRTPTAWGRAFHSFAGPAAGFLATAILLAASLLFGCRLVVVDGGGSLPIPIAYPFEWVAGVSSTNPLVFSAAWFVYGFVWINVFWGAINLVPIYPMDGGQIAMAFALKKNPKTGMKTALTISIVCAVLLALLFYREGSVFAAFFFGYLAYQNYRTMQFYGTRGF